MGDLKGEGREFLRRGVVKYCQNGMRRDSWEHVTLCRDSAQDGAVNWGALFNADKSEWLQIASRDTTTQDEGGAFVGMITVCQQVKAHRFEINQSIVLDCRSQRQLHAGKVRQENFWYAKNYPGTFFRVIF